MAECPLCGARSRRIHSRYDRQVADLPCAGKQIRLRVITRRFICEVLHCRRRIFAERFGDDVLPTRSRRTARLECIVHHLGIALGGRPAASFARRLMLPVSKDTLLRVVRRRTQPASGSSHRRRHRRLGLAPQPALRDHHLRSGATAGSSPCYLIASRRRREWLSGQPQIAVVARDRGGGYALAAAKALPHADPGRRPLAPDGECQPRLPRCRAHVPCDRSAAAGCDDRRSRVAHRRRADPVRGLPAPRGDQRWPSSRSPGTACRSRRSCAVPGTAAASSARSVRGQAYGCFPDPAEHSLEAHLPWLEAQWTAGLPQRRRTLASAAAAWLPRLAARGQGMGDPATTGREGRPINICKECLRRGRSPVF